MEVDSNTVSKNNKTTLNLLIEAADITFEPKQRETDHMKVPTATKYNENTITTINSNRSSGDGSKVGTNGSDGSTATFIDTGNASHPVLFKDGRSIDNSSQYTTTNSSKRVSGDGSKVGTNGSDGSTATFIDTGNASYP